MTSPSTTFPLPGSGIIAPSLLAADFGNLEREMSWFNRSAADWLHLDVMDGTFVPNISFGFPVIEHVAKLTRKPLDVHLMVVEPQRWVSQVRDLGAHVMNIHQEACPHLHRTLNQIHAAGMKTAVSLCPSTPITMLEDVLGDIDIVMIMTVNPGFGAQSFIEQSLEKIVRMKALISRYGLHTQVEVDGGVNRTTLPKLHAAGVDIYVSGSAIFNSTDPIKEIEEMKRIIM